MFLRTRHAGVAGPTPNRDSSFEAPTIRVLDAFTRGGAQRAGGQHTARPERRQRSRLRARHPLVPHRPAVRHACACAPTTRPNYLGTYTFESLRGVRAGRPRSYTQRVGDPDIRYNNLQGAWYVQDDMRMRRNLTLSAGVRYEAQTHVERLRRRDAARRRHVGAVQERRDDAAHELGHLPRLAAARAPTSRRCAWTASTSARWIIARPVVIPTSATSATAPPANRYLLDGDLRLPRTSRVSVGVDQRLHRLVQTSATYAYQRGVVGCLAGSTSNAPVDGVRPDPLFGNIVEVVSDAPVAAARGAVCADREPGRAVPGVQRPAHQLEARDACSPTTPGLNLKNNSDGAFAIAGHRQPGRRVGARAVQTCRTGSTSRSTTRSCRNFAGAVNFNINAERRPYTIRTGFDENGDLVYNDRPDGVARNTQRAPTAVDDQYGGRLHLPVRPPADAAAARASPSYAGGGGPHGQTVDQNARAVPAAVRRAGPER